MELASGHIDNTRRKKLHPRSVEYVFLGFDERRRSSKLMPVQGRRTVICRKYIIFHEGKTISNLEVKPNIIPLVTKLDQTWGPSVEIPPPIDNRAETENIL